MITVYLRKLQINNIVKRIKNKDFSKFDDEALRVKFYLEKERYLKTQNINSCLINIFAIVLEVFKRVMNIHVYDEQLICAIAMEKGYMVQMKTGEGKTISAVFTAILNSFKGQVHIVTVNEHLAKRDWENMNLVYEFLKIDCLANKDDISKKRKVYKSDVIYTWSSELIFDYLKNEIDSSYPFGKLDTAILDEIDFVLLDNANSSFSISASDSNEGLKNLNIYKAVKLIFDSFKGGEISNRIRGTLIEEDIKELELDYIYDKYEKTVQVTKQGLGKVEKIFEIDLLITNNLGLYKVLLLTIEAHVLLKDGIDYVVREGKIQLINRANGRIMKNSTKEFGLQQALEIKEGLRVSGVKNFQNRMSYQVFFSKYRYLTGMSGTLKGSQDELSELFKSEVYTVPTRRKNRRIDYLDMIFKTKDEKIKYLLEKLDKLHRAGQPILIITENEKEAQKVSELVKKEGLEGNVLSSDRLEDEEKIINYCGKYRSITISTNMVGRGTDVKLEERAKAAGGLFVISLNKFESNRIDNQVKGRAGRQGEGGCSIFLVSLEDTVFEGLEAHLLNKFKDLNNEVFYLEKNQNKLRKILNKLQRQTDSKAFKFRKYSFYLDTVIDNYKKYLLSYSKKMSIKEIFKQVIETEVPYLESSKNVIFLGKKIIENIDFKDFITSKEKEVDRKIEGFNKNIVKELSRSIINKTFRETWRDLHIELDNLKYDVMIRAGNLDRIVQEYIKESEEIVKKYLRFLNLKALDLFLRAEIKKNDNKKIKKIFDEEKINKDICKGVQTNK